jgi:hypothetical protein
VVRDIWDGGVAGSRFGLWDFRGLTAVAACGVGLLMAVTAFLPLHLRSASAPLALETAAALIALLAAYLLFGRFVRRERCGT